LNASRHCEEQSDEAIQSFFLYCRLDCFVEPVIGRAFARPGGADPLARNDGYIRFRRHFAFVSGHG
jgi:hypothetical protein